MIRKLRVGVLFGGKSGEHEVSLTSARSVMAAMDSEKYDVVPLGINKAGRWLRSGDPMYRLTDGEYRSLNGDGLEDDQADAAESLHPAALIPQSGAGQQVGLGDLDVIFPVLHGPMGEDGTVQGFLELLDVPYVGCGVVASAVGMDKVVMKDVFAAHDLPLLPYAVVMRKAWRMQPEQVLAGLESKLTYPMFVKPANMGSSVGITKAHALAELAAGLKLAAEYDRKIVVEQGIEAREVECSVLGNDAPIVSVVGEVVPSNEWYDYAAKYVDNSSNLLIPAHLGELETTTVQKLALQAFKALDCAGLARVDFLLDKVTGTVYLNEVNTLPGFTPVSMFPKLWEASGIPYAELIDRLIDLALECHKEKRLDHAKGQRGYSGDRF